MYGTQKQSDRFTLLRQMTGKIFDKCEKISDATSKSINDLIDELEIQFVELDHQNQGLKQTQKKISCKQKELERLYEFAPCGYILLNQDGTVKKVNRTGMKLLGWKASQIRLIEFMEYIDKSSEDAYIYSLQNIQTTKEGQSLDIKLKKCKKGVEWLHVAIEPEINDSGAITSYRLAFFDISERKQIQKELRLRDDEHEHIYSRLQLALECGNMGTWDRDLLTGNVVWNEQLYGLLDRSLDKPVTGETFFEYIHPEDLSRVRKHVETALAERDEFVDEFRIIRENGEIRWLHSSGKIIRAANNNPIGMSGINYDITGTKEAELERERLLAERTAVMENMNDGLTLADLSGNIIYHNPASLALHGYESLEEALMSKNEVSEQWEIYDTAGVPVPMDDWPMPRVLRGETFNKYELCVCRHDKDIEFIGSFNGTPVRDKAGEPIFAMLTIRDITDSKRAEQKIEWLSRFPKENPNPVIRISNDGDVLYANKAASCILDAWNTVTGGKLAKDIRANYFDNHGSKIIKTSELALENQVFLLYSVKVPEEQYFNMYANDISELKKTEVSLVESRNHLESIFQSSFDMIITVDKNRHIMDFNPAAEKTFGYDKKEVIGKHVGMLYADDKTSERTSREIYKKGTFFGEVMNRRKDGNTFPVFLSASLLRNNFGEITGKVSISHDITKRKRTANAFRKIREDLARAQQVGHIGSWRLDVHKNILYWSEENHRIFGIPKGISLRYETFLECVHPDDRKTVDKIWKSAIRGGEYDIEHRIMVDGKVKWVREKALMEYTQKGILKGAFGITQDITENKMLQEEVSRNAKLLSHTFEQFPGIVSLWDKRRHLKFINNKWEKVFGKQRKKIIGKTLRGVYPFEIIKEIEQFFRLAYETGSEQETITKHDTPDGEVIFWRRFFPLLDQQGNVDIVVDIGQEITTFERTRESLETIREELEKLVDLRTKELKKANEELWETNIALKKLVNEYGSREENAQNSILRSLDTLVRPYLVQLERQITHEDTGKLVEVIMANLDSVNMEFSHKLAALGEKLSPTELKIAHLIRNNYETNEIADILSIEIQTVFTHRRKIRKKLGMKNKNVNLKTYLMNISDT